MAFLRPELRAQPVFQKFLRRLPVPLIHGEEEKGHHQPDHQKYSRRIADRPAGKEIHRTADKPGKAETNKLALRQIEGQLGLTTRSILWYRYIRHLYTSHRNIISGPLPCTEIAYRFLRSRTFPHFLSRILQPCQDRNSRLSLTQVFLAVSDSGNIFPNIHIHVEHIRNR